MARTRWGGERDGELLVHLIEEGSQRLQAEERGRRDERLAALARISTRYADVFGDDYLADVRDGWPE